MASLRNLANNRIFYAGTAVGFAPIGGAINSARYASGVQSVGIDTSFDIEQVYQLGQLDVYSNVENIPNIEVTIEKVLDGTPLIQHLATPQTGLAPSLIGRYGNQRCDVSVAIYPDTNANASGTIRGACVMSGMYVSAINFNLPVDGNFTESVTLVGNNKRWTWLTDGNTQFIGYNTATVGPSSPPTGFVSRRQHILFGTGINSDVRNVSYLPIEIPGIDSTGFNRTYGAGVTGGANYAGFGAHLQSIQISCDLGRTELFELGKRGPYHRYLDFPVEVTCAIEVVDTEGDKITALEDTENNVTDQRIYLALSDGTLIDLGSKNRLTSVSSSGGDTGGGNRTVTYNYTNFNSITVTRTPLITATGGTGFLTVPNALDPAQLSDSTPFD